MPVLLTLAFYSLLPGCSPANPCRLASELASKAEELRELRFNHPVECSVESGSIVNRLAQGRSTVPPGSIPVQAEDPGQIVRQMFLFDSSEPGLEPSSGRSGLAPELVRGAYSFREKKLFLAAGVPQHQIEQTVVHELVHALQDQRFGLSTVIEPSSKVFNSGGELQADSDQQLARFALIEGDAVLDEYRYRYPKTDICSAEGVARFIDSIPTAENPGLGGFPAYSLYRREFSNRFGLRFVCIQTKQGRSRDDLFLHPPQSTSEIVFPEKSRRSDCPGLPVGAGAAGSGAELRFSDRFGLAGLLYFLGPDRIAELSGFRGDCTELFRRQDGKDFGVWRIEFSTSAQALRVSSLLQGRIRALGSAAGRSSWVSRLSFKTAGPLIEITTPQTTP